RTNRSILQMRPKYRGFATSDPRKGVFLTERGEREAARVLQKIGPPTCTGKPVELSVKTTVDPRRTGQPERTRNPAQIMQEVRSKILFRRYAEGKLEEADTVHFLGLIGLYDHSLPSEIRRQFRELRNDATEAKDAEVLQFLDSVALRFSD